MHALGVSAPRDAPPRHPPTPPSGWSKQEFRNRRRTSRWSSQIYCSVEYDCEPESIRLQFRAPSRAEIRLGGCGGRPGALYLHAAADSGIAGSREAGDAAHRDRRHADRLGEIDQLTHDRRVDDAVGVAEVGVGNGGAIGGVHRPPVRYHNRIVVDVHHPGTAMNRPGDLMHVRRGREPRSEISTFPRPASYNKAMVAEEGLTGSPDSDVVRTATAAGRLLVTLDRGLGDVRAYPPRSHAGVLVLRLTDQSAASVRRAAWSHVLGGRTLSTSFEAPPLPE